MVRAPVSERQLERAQAKRERDELVAEADAEERHLAQQPAHGLDLVAELGRVAGAVADEDRSRLELEQGVRLPRAGDDDGLDAARGQAADDRALAAEVEHDDPWTGADRIRLRRAGIERRRGREQLRPRPAPPPPG